MVVPVSHDGSTVMIPAWTTRERSGLLDEYYTSLLDKDEPTN